ncbi:MAG: serine hydrolase domain-containing protein [Acidimicrobiales bacterium]
MLIIVIGTVLVAAGCGLAWALRARSQTARLIGFPIAVIAALIGFTTVGVSLWARTATDNSQFARALVWGDSAYGDQHRFPSRPFAGAPQPVLFELVPNSPMADYRSPETDQPLPEVLEQSETTAFVVLRNNELLYEEYFNGSGREETQTSFSVAKSFVATLVGIAIDEGMIGGLDEPITLYLPELADRDDRFRDITVLHLITMSSGLSFEDGSSPWADPANTYHGTDLRTAALSTPEIVGPPGRVFDYNDWNVILLGLILERSSGMSVAGFTERYLWQPMGAEAAGSWSLDSQEAGFEKMFVGVNGRAIDFVKLGWLYLHGGRNGETQVVPSQFVRDATKLDISTDPTAQYQYLWWIDQDRNAYFAQGDHGQFIYVHPDTEIVIVRHGTTPADVDWVEFMGDLALWLEANGEPR